MQGSDNGIKVTQGSAGSIVKGAYHLNGQPGKKGGNHIEIEDADCLFSQQRMSISLDFKADEKGVGGSLFRVHKALQIDVTDRGDVVFDLQENSAGESGKVVSNGLDVTDGKWHTVTLSYDSVGGVMKGYVDGVDVGHLRISAPTKAAEQWDPTIGHPWGNGFVGAVDNVVFEGASAAERTTPVRETDSSSSKPDKSPTPSPAKPSSDAEESSQLFLLQFNNGKLLDLSGNDVAITHGTSRSAEGGQYHLNGENGKNGGNHIAIERADALFSREEFTISLDFQADGPRGGGTLFNIHKAIEIKVNDNGQAVFDLIENSVGERGTITTKGLDLLDGKMHEFKLSYDASAGAMKGYVDGVAYGQIAVSGATKAAEYWDPSIGGPWGNGARGYVDNIEITGRGESSSPRPEPTKPVDVPQSEGPLNAAAVSSLFAAAKKAYADPVLANNSAEFVQALEKASGGETILLRPDVDYAGMIKNVSPRGDVTVTSLDPSQAATITGLNLRSVDNITFDNLHFEHGRGPAPRKIVVVSDSESVQFTNSVFEGSADGAPADGNSAAESMMHVSGSRNFAFEGNDVSGFLHGLSVLESHDTAVERNEFHHMQGDGMRFAQVNGINIENNQFREFYGSPNAVTHNDYIQFWTTNTTKPSSDIVIRENTMLSGEFQSQAIFFRDQLGDKGKGEMRFQDVRIEENVIYNNHYHGITVPNADGLTIRGNTLIIHPEADRTTSSINVKNSTGVDVSDNVTPRMNIDDDNKISRLSGNVVVQDDDAAKPGYVESLFLNAGYGAGAELSNVYVGSDSALARSNGTVFGSELLRMPASSDELTAIVVGSGNGRKISFDASHTAGKRGLVGEDDARFTWDFGDGHTKNGIHVSHTYDKPGGYDVMLTVLARNGEKDTAHFAVDMDVPERSVLDFNRSELTFKIDHPDDIWGA